MESESNNVAPHARAVSAIATPRKFDRIPFSTSFHFFVALPFFSNRTVSNDKVSLVSLFQEKHVVDVDFWEH